MIVRSKAPLRVGLAGGGTDISPYCDIFGGVVLNFTINKFVHCIIEERKDKKIIFVASDLKITDEIELSKYEDFYTKLKIHNAVYKRIIKDFNNNMLMPCKILTYSDAPPGSGLGSSSTLVVAIVKAFVELLKLPLGEYEVAKLAFEIERVDLKLEGGKQDQFAATFGGVNFMEFYNNNVIVNPLRIKRWIIDELEESSFLFNSGYSRESDKIIKVQKNNVIRQNKQSIEAMHRIKSNAIKMKAALLKGEIEYISNLLSEAWIEKKKMAKEITNNYMDEIIDFSMRKGALSAKVSGAGGGGFIYFLVEPTKKKYLMDELNKFGKGKAESYQITEGGCHGWSIYRS